MSTEPILNYYKTPGPITKLDKYSEFLQWLTDDVRAIYQVVQGIIVHDAWLRFYGIEMDKKQVCEFNISYMEDIFDKALELANTSLAIPRSPNKRVIACCREFATLFCAILRHKGIPARSRCGFATYLARDGYFEDHWICEYWNGSRWVKVDPQLDPFQQSGVQSWVLNNPDVSSDFKEKIKNLNPLDLTDSDFIVAGKAWKMCREMNYAPDRFGISCDPKKFGLDTLYGLWFVRGNLLRDFASLNKVESVPYLIRIFNKLDWNSWRLISSKDDMLTDFDWILLDNIAELSIQVDNSFDEILSTYDTNSDLQVPKEVMVRQSI